MNGLSRLGLALKTTHPDQVGGLDLLIGVQYSFGVIFTALGATASETFAREIIHLGSTLSEVQLPIIGFVLICFVIITGPLCTFSNLLISVDP